MTKVDFFINGSVLSSCQDFQKVQVYVRVKLKVNYEEKRQSRIKAQITCLQICLRNRSLQQFENYKMPKTTYSQHSLNNLEYFMDNQSLRKLKKKTKIHKKKFKTHRNSANYRRSKNGKRSTSILRYKSAYSPEYTIQIHDIEMSSFHSDQILPRCSHSDDQIEYTQIESIPVAGQSTQQEFRRFHQDYERRDLERIMRGCRVTEEIEQKMVD